MRDELILTTIRDLSGASAAPFPRSRSLRLVFRRSTVTSTFSATPLDLIQALSQLERGESSVSLGPVHCERRPREHTDQGQRRRALAFIAENRPTCLRKMAAKLTLSERS
jgi:hypothetical protein